MNDTKSYLQTLPFWKDLTEMEQQEIENAVYFRHFEPATLIYGNGEESLGMMYILSGAVRAFLLSDEGREVTLYRLQQDDMTILSPSSVISQVSFETYMVSTEPTDVLMIPTAEYSDLMERNIHVRCFTYELVANRFSVTMWVLQQILFARFDQRLATFLLEEYGRTGSPEICMTQEHIAEYVNSAREVVARMLKRFASDGLIENHRGVIELKDIPALQKLTGVQPQST